MTIMVEKKRIDHPTGTETVGHEWDGIEELNTPLPRWWLCTLWATIIWAIGYVIVFPAIPMLNSASTGTSGWTSRGQLKAEMVQEAQRRAPVVSVLATLPVEQLASDEKLLRAAVEGGRAAFKVHCVQCHGSGGAGSKGYPNLNDDDWLWGGDLPTIHFTLTHGIRNPEHAETRMSQMPAFEQVLKPAEIGQVVAHVRVLSGQQKPDAASAAGAALYAQNCVVCHGEAGKGDRAQGAPNLTDGIWLYGGDANTLHQTIAKSRYGVMPRWNDKLDPATITMLAAYVHSLGGGEAMSAETQVTALPATAGR
jgi:cytochrome c oxidase cbb3-type subunit III